MPIARFLRHSIAATSPHKDSLIINAAPGFGAIEAAIHEFYAKQKDGAEHLDASAKLTEIWTKASGSWKLMRVISYDHK